jgi:hypothetical protein
MQNPGSRPAGFCCSDELADGVWVRGYARGVVGLAVFDVASCIRTLQSLAVAVAVPSTLAEVPTKS